MQKVFFRLVEMMLVFAALLTCIASCNTAGTGAETSAQAEITESTETVSPETESAPVTTVQDSVTEEETSAHESEETMKDSESVTTEEATSAPETEPIEEIYQPLDDTTLADGSSVRIMSWNLLFESADCPVAPRASLAAEVIRAYAPDVIGTQETCPEWYEELSYLLSDSYRFVTRKNAKNGDNYSTLWYNTETVRFVEWGVRNYTEGQNTTMRLVTWAVFERLDGGERFIVTSTHWDVNSGNKYENRIMQQARELVALIEDIREEHPYPMFCTGDYNRVPGTNQYKSFIEWSGFSDAPNVAESYKRLQHTYHNVGEPIFSVGLIDHIFCSPESNVIFYNTIIDSYAVDASDHCPIYIDINVGK